MSHRAWGSVRDAFLWSGGIENTLIPQGRPGLRPLEEYELTQHYQQWREDLQRAASLGIKRLRWGVPWYRVESQPGVFDWTWVDEVLFYLLDELHIEPIVDLVHYGTPLWLEDSFANPEYPQRVASYAGAFAQRYKDRVRFYTPLNEPAVNAQFCGQRGEWPPYLHGDEGYVRVLLAVARGIQLTAREIRRHDPHAVLFAVEAMNWYQARTPEVQAATLQKEQMNFLCWDLVNGRVDATHPLYAWLQAQGTSQSQLDVLRADAIAYDIFGVNFYPWSACTIASDGSGGIQEEVVPMNGHLLADVLRRCYAHTHLPLMITETSANGTLDERIRWMDETLAAVHAVSLEDIPVLGYTWFPLFTMVEWEYRLSEKPLQDHFIHLGLWDSAFDEQGVLVRHETPLVEHYQAYISGRTSPVDTEGIPASVLNTSNANQHF